ncbi:MAG: nucleoside triphosphate pyrophosphohydrolase, partial [Bacteroidales bacterium]|nr:nucleoside triphosphate pyrophosphohydrolase [Bacteroidales bacterium]
MHTREEKLEQYGRLLDIMDTLREKCPWNRAQTNESLRPMTIEETYELSDAVLRKDSEDIKKELGDILLHVVFYAHIAEEEGRFDMADVASRECEKMIFRHPHIFGNGASEGLTEEEVAKNWELIKTKEKGGNRTILGGVPDSFPPVLKAYTLQDKASAVGFDWEKKEDVWEKVKEECGEYQAELDAMADKVVYTGAIDQYFNFSEGTLEYRSVRFETEVLDKPNFQGNAAVNYTDAETPWTRIIEHKWFEFGKDEEGNDLPRTVISHEFSSEWKPGDEPYYPVNDEKNGAVYEAYKKLAEK